jgi:hypothetical protein
VFLCAGAYAMLNISYLYVFEYIVFVFILLRHLEREGERDTLGMRLAIVIAWPETSMIAPRGHR